MPETVRMYGGVAAQIGGVKLDDEFDAAPGQPPAAVIEKDRRFRGCSLALREIALERGFGFGAVGDLPFFSAFAANAQPPLAPVGMVKLQPHHPPTPQSAAS